MLFTLLVPVGENSVPHKLISRALHEETRKVTFTVRPPKVHGDFPFELDLAISHLNVTTPDPDIDQSVIGSLPTRINHVVSPMYVTRS